MEIRNNFTQPIKHPSFGAIKIVKCNNIDVMSVLHECDEFFALKPHKLFKGKSIFHSELANTIAIQAQKMGQTQEWLTQNAKLHGINVPETDTAPFFDVTGEDLVKLSKFRLKNILKMVFFNLKSQNKPEVKALPPHLRWIKILSDFADKKQADFDKFLKKNNAVEMNFRDYVTSLISELS